MHPQQARPRSLQSTIVRTGPRAPAPLRWLLGGASRLAPRVTARWGEARFLTPLRQRGGTRAPEVWARAAAEPFPFEDLDLASWSWGEGERTVWLVHGWSGSSRQLAGMVPALEAVGWRVRAWDHPAHGASPGRRTHLAQLSRVLAAAALRFGPPDAVIAHSFGAAATSLALARGLPAGRVALLAAPAELEHFGAVFAHFLGLSDGVRRRLQERVADRIGGSWRDLAPERLGPHLGAVPALVVHDVGDPEVPVEHGRRLSAAWPGAELVLTEGLGHNRILRDAAVVERVRGFVTAERAAALQEGGAVRVGGRSPARGGRREAEGGR